MGKHGNNKATNYESIWLSAMAIEYLAQEEIGAFRQPHEDLLIERIDSWQRLTTQSIGYVALNVRKTPTRWPVLTTIEPTYDVTHDVFTLVEGDAKQEVFYPHRLRLTKGPQTIRDYAVRMLELETALRDPSVRHYFEFEHSGVYNSGSSSS